MTEAADFGSGEHGGAAVDQDALRRDLRAWLDRHGWYVEQMVRALQVTDGWRPLNRKFAHAFLHGATIQDRHALRLKGFLADYPEPGSYRDWECTLRVKAIERGQDRQATIAARAEAVERDRAARVRALLAAERRPVERTWFPSARWLGREARAA